MLDQERVYNDLVRDMPPFVKTLWLPKSGGVVERSVDQRISSRDVRVKQYFYGSTSKLYPHSFEVNYFNSINFYSIIIYMAPYKFLHTGKILRGEGQDLQDRRTHLARQLHATWHGGQSGGEQDQVCTEHAVTLISTPPTLHAPDALLTSDLRSSAYGNEQITNW